MKRCSLALLAVASFLAMPVHALQIWHSNTVWVGQGQCSASITFDSQMEEIEDLQVVVSVFNKAGKKVKTEVLEVESLGWSNAERYTNDFLEGEEMCADDLTIVVNKANAVIAGKRTDLLKTKAITAPEFKPFKIRVSR